MLLLASALAAPLATMECSSLTDLEVAVGFDEVLETLSQEFPEQADRLGSWTLQGLRERGVDADRPTRLEVLGEADGTHLVWDLGLADAGAFQDFGKELVGGPLRESWKVAVRTIGDRGLIELVTEDPIRDLGEGPIDRLLALAESEPGCVLAMGLADASQLDARLSMGAAGVMVQLFRERPDELSVRVHSAEMPSGLEGLEARRPVRRQRAVGTWTPTLTSRVNLDLEEALGLLAATASLTDNEALTQALTALEDSGLVLASGMEVAAMVSLSSGSFRVLVAMPLARPRRARAVVRHLATEPGAGRYDQGVVELSLDGRPLFVGARGRHLLVGTGWQDVVDATRGRGEPLITHPWASEPGLFIGLEQPLPPAMGSALSGPSGDQPAALLVTVEEEGLSLRLSLPGLSERLQEAALGPARSWLAPEEAADDLLVVELPDTPSSAPLATLMLIRESQLRAVEEQGAPVAYSGGPRPREDLDGEPVPWSGIPGTDFTGGLTACRYEVDVVEQTWSALAICDEDADGEVSLYMTSNERLPLRLSPVSVR